MPELPEISSRAREIKAELVGRTIKGVEVLQPKCLNVSAKKFASALEGAKIRDVTYHGKWIFVDTSRGHLLLNMGMGGEILLTDRKHMPEKYRVAFDLKGGATLAVNFWWFGYAHHVAEGRLGKHEMTAKLGPNALDLTRDEFAELLRGRRGGIKSFLLNQERIAGIGNAYIHDILFFAGLHPLRSIDTLTDDEVTALFEAVGKGLRPSERKGGAFYEKDIHGKPGRFKRKDIVVGYSEGKPCPTCGTPIEKIKTGSNASFVCPRCQPLKPGRKRAAGGRKAATGGRQRATGGTQGTPRSGGRRKRAAKGKGSPR